MNRRLFSLAAALALRGAACPGSGGCSGERALRGDPLPGGVAVMPNGKPGDHPLNDMFSHGAHPFPPDVEGLIRRLAAIDPLLLEQIERDVFEWEAGQQLDEGRAKLRDLIAKARPNPSSGGKGPA